MGKLVIFSAPSGSGKSTLVNHLMSQPDANFAFSISCTSRAPRGEEQNGREYYFLSPEEFRHRIANDEFLEYEEVYTDKFYGTLKSEVERLSAEGKTVLFEVQPPSIEELSRRLHSRGTDAEDVIQVRLDKAAYELTFAPQFDRIIVNDDLDTAKAEVVRVVDDFLNDKD